MRLRPRPGLSVTVSGSPTSGLNNGRAAKLGGRLAVAVRELDRLAELSRAVPGSLRRGWRESVAGYQARVGRLLDESRQYPVLTEALADVAAEMLGEKEFDVNDPQMAHIAYQLGLCG